MAFFLCFSPKVEVSRYGMAGSATPVPLHSTATGRAGGGIGGVGDVGDQGVGGQDQLGDRHRVQQCQRGDLDRIDDPGGEQVAEPAGAGVEAEPFGKSGDPGGDAVSVQVRGTDYAAAAIAALLGAATVADVLYLNIRDRAAEYALLYATGWHDGAVTRLVLTEAAAMAVAGAVGGAAVGLAAYATFAGSLSPAVTLPTVATVCGAITLTVLTATSPLRALRHHPLTRHLTS